MSVLLLAALTAVYFAAGKLGLAFAFEHPSAAPIWPPAGIALAAFLLLGNRVWPAVFVGAFLVNVTTAGSIVTSLAIAIGNTVEGWVGASLTRRFANAPDAFHRGRDVFRFVLLAGVVSTALSPSVGVTSLTLAGFADVERYGAIWLTWWLGDLGSNLVFAPVLLLWAINPRPGWSRIQTVEATALVLSTIAVALVVFHPVAPVPEARYPLAYLCFPVLVWAGFRFGPRESATLVLLIGVIAVWKTWQGTGPFATGSPNLSLVLLEAFLATASLTSLGLAAVVSERKRNQAELGRAEARLEALLANEQRQKLEAQASSRTKDQFLAVLGHELRSPLAALSNATSALELLRRDDDASASLHAILRRQTEYLTRLVSDLLDVSRLDSGRIELRDDPVDLKSAVERCLECFRIAGKLDAHDVAVSLDAVWIRGDAIRLEQIVGNLLDNSLKYTPAGGRIEIDVGCEGDVALLRVRDDGQGIDPEALPRIFDFFAQTERSLDRTHGGGLGIGLNLVRRLAELHGGTIEVLSGGRGRGSEFRVRLPLVAPPPDDDSRAVENPNRTHPARRRLRVLVIEDYADARLALVHLLADWGHAVEAVDDGRRGLAHALASPADVALIDIGLPGLNGYEVARSIRTSDAGRNTLLIALTGYGGAEERRCAFDAGFDECLVKPVDADRLAAILAESPLPPPSHGVGDTGDLVAKAP